MAFESNNPTPRVPPERWDLIEDAFKYYYITEGRTLRESMLIMEAQFDFTARYV